MQEEKDIRSMNLEETWGTYLAEGGQETSDYNQVRYGIRIKFDIHYWLEKMYIIKPKSGRISIRGASYNISDVWTEMENREIMMKEYLMSLEEETGLDAK